MSRLELSESTSIFEPSERVNRLKPEGPIEEWFFRVVLPWLKEAQDPVEIAIQASVSSGRYYALQECAGIELVFLIRLSGRWHSHSCCPIVIHSFESREAIVRRHPRYAVLLSQGISFWRLPTPDGEISWKPTAIVSLEDAFSPFVRAHYREPDSEHDFSNWWGAHRLMEAICAADGKAVPESFREGHSIRWRRLETLECLFLHQRPREVSPSGFSTKAAEARFQQRVARWRELARLPKVVHVDDEMNEGWADAMAAAIYGAGEAVPAEYVPISDTADIGRIADMIVSARPDLAIVDLRLQRGLDRDQPVSRSSGAMLIGNLRKAAPGIPILLATASNKAWTYREMRKLGADSYWMKEGISEHEGEESSMANALRLREILDILLGRKYQFLRRLGLAIQLLESQGNHWWSDKQWQLSPRDQGYLAPSHSDVDSTLIFALLEKLVMSLRDYLRTFESREEFVGNEPTSVRQAMLDQMLVLIGKIVEAIHAFDQIRISDEQNGTQWARAAILTSRRDAIGYALLSCRHEGAHWNLRSTTELDDYERRVFAVLSLAVAWLAIADAVLTDSWDYDLDPKKLNTLVVRKDAQLLPLYQKLSGEQEILLPI